MGGEGGGWDFNRVVSFVTEENRPELMAVVVDTVTRSRDRLSWGHTPDGKFTVKSAYAMLTNDETPRQHMGLFFRGMWRVVASERVRMFLWLVGNQAIMTNAERYRRHLSGTDMCQVCRGGTETIMHVLRDCPAVKGIWERFVPRRRRNAFFSMQLFEWLYKNLNEKSVEGGIRVGYDLCVDYMVGVEVEVWECVW